VRDAIIFVCRLAFLIISRANITYATGCTEPGRYMVNHVRLTIECDKISRCSFHLNLSRFSLFAEVFDKKRCIFQGVLSLLVKLN